MPNQDERPATKHDLDQLEARLVEVTRDMQTEVLRAFHTSARPAAVNAQAKLTETLDRFIEDRKERPEELN